MKNFFQSKIFAVSMDVENDDLKLLSAVVSRIRSYAGYVVFSSLVCLFIILYNASIESIYM